MSRYPSDFYTEVNIDAYQMVDYVRENWDYFCEEVGDKLPSRDVLTDVVKIISETLNKYDNVRRYRDHSSQNRNDTHVKLYEELESIKEYIEKQI